MDTISEDFFTLYQNLFSPQVKRSMIISNKHGKCKLPHEFDEPLKTQEFRKLGKIRKISKLRIIL